ncbi:MAG: prepilin-type N-terminal cleavage/methylation domain-containing protein [Phycisphaerales bacterium]|nr:prepilin-type N-terminal cleavage/methylation domain-containing protein [Phycisphaerales bacterium]
MARARCRSGFTLIELVVSMTIGAIISGAAAMLILNASRNRAETAARAELVDTAGAALETMIHYVRQIPQDECPLAATPCLNGNAQIDAADVSSLEFDSIGFRLSGSTIEMSNDSGSSWHPLLRDTASLTFTYYNRSGVALGTLPLSAGDRADVRRVTIAISVSRGGEALDLRTSVYLRAFLDEVTSDP